MSEKKKFKDFSIIIPVYNNEENLVITMNTLLNQVIYKQVLSGEIIFIDDGSTDKSFELLLKIKKEYPELVRVIKLSRNFGQGAAVTAGFQNFNSKFAVTIDADLQDPPQLINEMLDAYFSDGFEVTIGVRKARKESMYRRFTSLLWYNFIRKITFEAIPKKGFNVFGLSKRVANIILKNVNQASPLSQLMIMWAGFPAKQIPYTRNKRELGKSQYSFAKKMITVIDSIVSFSYFPIRFMSVLGIIISFLGFLYAISIAITRLTGGKVPFEGWAPIMILILVLSGFQMIMLGIIGEYLWRGIEAIRNRDLYIIDEIYD